MVANVKTQDNQVAPVRVLYVDHTAKMGGGEIALVNLVTNLDRSRFEPIVLLGASGELQVRLQASGIETHVLELDEGVRETRKGTLGPRYVLQFGLLAKSLQYVREIAKFVRGHSIDIVHTNSLKSDIMGGLAARMMGVPVIWHVRDRIADDYLPASVARTFRLLCRLIPNYVIANSAATLETLALRRSKPNDVVYSSSRRLHVVHDGLAQQAAQHTPGFSERRSPHEQPHVGLVGRITPWKGQHIFIRAARKVADCYPEAEFLIVGSAMFGEEDYEEELHRLVAECGMEERIHFLGFRTDVDSLIASLDVLVHASTVPEPFGQVVIEGMAGGTPVVATRGGGVTEIIEDGVTGTLIAMGSVEEMAAAIVASLRDRERATRMAAAARVAVRERFTIEITVEKIQRIYDGMSRRSTTQTTHCSATPNT